MKNKLILILILLCISCSNNESKKNTTLIQSLTLHDSLTQIKNLQDSTLQKPFDSIPFSHIDIKDFYEIRVKYLKFRNHNSESWTQEANKIIDSIIKYNIDNFQKEYEEFSTDSHLATFLSKENPATLNSDLFPGIISNKIITFTISTETYFPLGTIYPNYHISPYNYSFELNKFLTLNDILKLNNEQLSILLIDQLKEYYLEPDLSDQELNSIVKYITNKNNTDFFIKSNEIDFFYYYNGEQERLSIEYIQLSDFLTDTLKVNLR